MSTIEDSIVFNFATKSLVEEGAKCPSCSAGVLEFLCPDDCACHIWPPCSACTDNCLTCSECFEDFKP